MEEGKNETMRIGQPVLIWELLPTVIEEVSRELGC